MNDATQFFNTTAGGGYEIERSLRFNSSDSAYLSKNFASSGDRQKFTLSWWIKRCNPASSNKRIFGYSTGTNQFSVMHDSTGAFYFYADVTSPTDTVELTSSAKFRDSSAWYHFVMALDTTQATDSNRVKVWVNGTQITSWATTNWPSQNGQFYWNASGIDLKIGGIPSFYIDGYLAEVHSIDGQALDPTSFGEFDDNGVWQPKAYTGSYGTNGFHLPFSDNSTAAALGTDTSGNSNTWTVNNISVTAGAGNDSVVDSPTNYGTDTGAGGEVRGNYCTWNPLTKGTYTNGNLDSSNTTYQIGTGTIGVSSGKWYWEVAKTDSGTTHTIAGITPLVYSTAEYLGLSANGYGLYFFNGNLIYNGSGSGAYGAFSQNDILNVALDLDNGKVWFGKNGTWFNSGNPAAGTNALGTGLTGTWYPGVSTASGTVTTTLNAGQRPFAYTAPSGFKALCTTNLPAPVVAKPNEVMDVVLYTGNGSTQTISGLNFSPDLVWLKRRDSADSHQLFDIIRGATNFLGSDTTNAEQTLATLLTSFNSDGFSIGSYYPSSSTWAAWTWDAGSSTVTNTQGSITSQVRANASAGFSIVTYTGTGSNATVGHGLGVAPQLVIVKGRGTSYDWIVWHQAFAATSYIALNATSAVNTSLPTVWNSTAPTSTVFSIGTALGVNTSGSGYVAYCFAPVAGYSSFGSYTGNGSADGPFVYTGFRPRWLMWKPLSPGTDWVVRDAARDSYNIISNYLLANSSVAEGSIAEIDFLSNGFKFRNNLSGNNTNGVQVIYACFAEHPFATARAR